MVMLTPPGTYPLQYFKFALCVTDDPEEPSVKIGRDGKPLRINLSNQKHCDEFFQGIIDNVKEQITNPKDTTGKTYGFQVSPLLDDEARVATQK
jgi:hypothetical protein